MARTCTYSHPIWRLVTIAMLAVLATCAAPAMVVTAAAPAPDLSLVVRGPSAVGVDALFYEKVIVTNHGTGPAPGVTVSYSTGGPSISPFRGGGHGVHRTLSEATAGVEAVTRSLATVAPNRCLPDSPQVTASQSPSR